MSEAPRDPNLSDAVNSSVNSETSHAETSNTETPHSAAATQGAEQETSRHNVIIEEFKVNGEAIVSKVKEIIREGNIRRITLKNDEGKTLLEIPLALGVVGGLLLPTLAAIGAIGALIANLSIKVERVEKVKDADTATDSAAKPEVLEAAN